MSAIGKVKEKIKEFKPTSWSITNKTSIYLVMVIITLIGIYQFLTLPKEQFPDIVIPTVFVQTIYVGNSPKDIENLVTRPIEKQIKGSSSNGNSQKYGNAEETEVNDKFAKYFEDDQLAKWKDESYKRVPSPVYNETLLKNKKGGKNKFCCVPRFC